VESPLRHKRTGEMMRARGEVGAGMPVFAAAWQPAELKETFNPSVAAFGERPRVSNRLSPVKRRLSRSDLE